MLIIYPETFRYPCKAPKGNKQIEEIFDEIDEEFAEESINI